jgi:hypothetical protein
MIPGGIVEERPNSARFRHIAFPSRAREQAVSSSAKYGEVPGESMAKRIMLVVVGAGIGSLAGLLVSFLGAGNWALIGGAVLGGVIPPLVLGPPSHPS